MDLLKSTTPGMLSDGFDARTKVATNTTERIPTRDFIILISTNKG
jgi:hypothetical protein